MTKPIIPEAISKHSKDKRMTGSIDYKREAMPDNLIAFCVERTSSVDEGRAVGIVYLDLARLLTLSYNIIIDKLIR